MTERRFRLGIAALALIGFGTRAAYGLAAHVPNGAGDDVWYHQVANGLAHGRGFVDPLLSVSHGAVVFGHGGEPLVTAFHPPLFPALLAVFSWVGLDSYTAHQAVGWALGAGTVVVVGLIGRRLGGQRAGLVTAAIAALFLPLVIRDSLLMSESLYGLLIALVLLAALRFRDRPSARRAIALGVAIGLAVLTRSEAVLLVLLLAAPLCRRHVANFALVCAAVAVVCVPWCVRNSIDFHQVTFVTTGDGAVLAGANLDSTYHGKLLGAWDFKGLAERAAARPPDPNEAVQSDRGRSDGLRDMRDHAAFASDYYTHIRGLEYVSQAMLLAAIGFAIAGAVGLRPRREPLWPLLAPIVLVGIVTLAAFGDPRFRQAADVSLVVMAGAGVAGIKGRRWQRPSR